MFLLHINAGCRLQTTLLILLMISSCLFLFPWLSSGLLNITVLGPVKKILICV
jgi:hypothetical protein